MEQKKSLNYYMRLLHRDIGYFVIGFVIIYALSGIILTYRDTDLLKKETNIEKTLPKNLDPSKLGEMLRIRDFKVAETTGTTIYFKNGSYNSSTGLAKYVTKESLPFLEKFFNLHKAPSKNAIHWVNLVFGISLLFLALSSFWMYKKGSQLFRRGLYISMAGIAIALILVYL